MNSLDRLIALANDYGSSPEEVAHAADEVNRALVDASAEEQLAAMDALIPVLRDHPDDRIVGPLATICGAIVERDYACLQLAEVIKRRLPDMLQLAAQFHEVWRQQVEEEGIQHPSEIETNSEEELEAAFEKYYSPAGQLMNIMPEAGAAWEGLQTFWPACVALFSKDPAARKYMRQYRALAETIGEEHEGGYWLSKLLQVREYEPLLVLDPGTSTGFTGTMSGIADNFQLHMFLMDIWKPKAGWLSKMFASPGLSPQVAQLIRGEGPQQLSEEVHGRWNLLTWQALDRDGKLVNSGTEHSNHWIWHEGSPADIPTFEELRVVILAPASYPRSWNACRLFPKLNAEMTIDKWLDKDEVNEWLQKLGNANST